jgi:chromosomal replication initiator protein
MNIDNVWEKTLKTIEKKVGTQTFDLWFKPIKLLAVENHHLSLEVPNRFFKEWIEDHYQGMLTEALEGFLHERPKIDIKVLEGRLESPQKKIETKRENRRARLANRGIFLNPKYTFENYVVGSSNQFARAASMAVANSPGQAYNPLFIYGGVGLGKTHLMHAIGNLIIDKRRDVKLLYTPAEQFTNEFVYSMRNNRMESFKNSYRHLDVILIDDIQFIAGKSGTQEELFHTFNALYDSYKQIVFSSDRLPKDISPITERLRSRFGMGLIADIQVPDVETKVAILGKKSDIEGIPLPQDVALFLATKIKSNVRELEACLIRLGAHSSLSGIPITVEMARDVLKDLIHEEERVLDIGTIQKTVCEYYRLKIQDLKAKKRTKEIAFPRQVAMYLCKMLTEVRRKNDEDFNRRLEYLIKKLGSYG